MPIPSRPRHAEATRHPRGPQGRPGPRHALAGALLALCSLAVTAHESASDAAPLANGWQLGAGLVAQAASANGRWPRESRPGLLLQGSAPPRQDGRLRLAGGSAALGARLGDSSAWLAAALHDDGDLHWEAALRHEGTRWGGRWRATAGRQPVPFGAAIDASQSGDGLAQRPLALLAATDNAWVEDGLHLGWQAEPPLDEAADTAPAVRGVGAGLWRARRFPAGPTGPAAPTLHLHLGWGHADLNLGAATMRPGARGAAVARAGQEGHLHGPPDCREGLAQKVCFDGRVSLWLASLALQPEEGPLARTRWTLGAVQRSEDGLLYATGGEATLRSRVHGLWLDAGWQPAAGWTLLLRLERLQGRHHLAGVGTTLLAREAGLEAATPVERATLAAQLDLNGEWQIGLEAGRERQATTRRDHVALRLVWRQAELLGGGW